jgi:hypothetical protein
MNKTELHELRLIIDLLDRIEQSIERVLREITHPKQRLSSIRIVFNPKGASMATVGPVTLTKVGQVATASVVGFDQFGNPMPSDFVMPAVTWTDDDAAGAIVTLDATAGTVTAVANGVANLTASVTSAEGLALTDTEAVTVAIPVATPVLSSIKIAFA